jgi:hypothetical protein
MKKLFVLIAIFSFALLAQPEAFAQKNNRKAEKAESKKWKKRMKDMDPIQFKGMYEDVNAMKAENAALKKNIEKLEGQTRGQESLTASKDQEIEALQRKLQEIQADCGKNVTAGGDDYTKGIVYKVQIGAFRNKNLSKFQEKGNFWTEDEDGVKKYTIGFFRDYWEADTFKKYLREMGVKDAWIVAYEDNRRKDIKDVLESSGRAGLD